MEAVTAAAITTVRLRVAGMAGIARLLAAAGTVVPRAVEMAAQVAFDRHLKEVALAAAGSVLHREAAAPVAVGFVLHREVAAPVVQGALNTSPRAPPRPINAASATDACREAAALAAPLDLRCSDTWSGLRGMQCPSLIE